MRNSLNANFSKPQKSHYARTRCSQLQMVCWSKQISSDTFVAGYTQKSKSKYGILRIFWTSLIFLSQCKIQQHLCLGQSEFKVCFPIRSVIFPFEISSLRMSLNKAKAVAQRKILAAAQSREANMALVLVCTVLMFIICHAPRLFTSRYVFISFL